MRYRLTVISVFAAALVAAALVFALNGSDGTPPERTQPELFPDGLGIVAAFTATAQAGGAALDPTAIATPTSTSTAPEPTPTPQPTVATAVPGTPGRPAVKLSSDTAEPGDGITVDVSGAVPGESFEITVGGTPVDASSLPVDATGNTKIEITVPTGVSGDSVEVMLVGSQSGANSTTISVSDGAPNIAVMPEQPGPGESITVSAEGFEPGEAVTISVAGEQVGSGFADQDGNFSMTTGLPELPTAASGPQPLSVNGDAGSVASTDFTVPGQPAPSGSPGSRGAPVGGSGAGEGAPGSGESPQSELSAGVGAMPTWVYIVIGAMAGWTGILTLWVYRLDRDRDAQFKFMQGVITELVSSKEADSEPVPTEDDTSDATKAA